MKKNLFVLNFLFSVFSVFAAQVQKPDYIMNDKRIFEDARIAFESQEYGKALNLCERAEASRRNRTDWEVYVLQNSFKPAEVKIRGDAITDVLPVLEERQDFDALEIISRYQKFYGLESFRNSCRGLVSFIKERRVFPEAEYLKGKIYQIEGEYEVSERLLLEAYRYSQILDVPDEKYDILYSLSDISYTQKDFSKYEEYLLLILSNDSAFKDSNLLSAMNNTIRSAKSDCMEKFFRMYRSSNYRLLKAYFRLSEYYLSKNERERALNCVALGSLTGFTKIYEVAEKRNPEFEYKGFAELMKEASSYQDLVEWGKDNGVWKGFNDFAEEAFFASCPFFSVSLYNALKDSSPEEYWRIDAEKKLKVVTGEERLYSDGNQKL